MTLPPTPAPIRTRPTWRRQLVVTLLVALVLVGGVVGYYKLFPSADPAQSAQRGRRPFGPGGPGGAGGSGGPAVPVLTAQAKQADVPVYLDNVGTVRALNTVTVRSQVDGKLISIAFKEGQDVQKGDVVARIDPTTFQALYDQAVAKQAQDEAQLANARLDLERYERLASTNAGTRQQADTQKATVAQLAALVNSDKAAVDNARAVLSYTNVIAPLSGRTGIRQVDEGNIVHASDTTGLVVITQLRPISVFFNLPQQQLPQVTAAFGKGPLPVDTVRSDDQRALDHGVLQVIDNQVDQTTGTVRLKAEFPNADLQLWPGQFVNVRMLVETLRQVTTVPTAAIQRGPDGAFVYVLNPDSTVAMRPVAVTRQDDVQAVIGKGVEVADQVVTTGFAQLTDGRRVTVANGADNTTAPAAAPRSGNRRRPGGATNPDAGPQTGPEAQRLPGTGGAAPAGTPPADGQTRPRRERQGANGSAPATTGAVTEAQQSAPNGR